MIIQSLGIILKVERFQENGLIVRCFTQSHGKLSGFVKCTSKKFGSDLIPGNICNIRWQARLEEHLGSIKLETLENVFCKTQKAFNTNILSYVTSLLESNFKERVQAEKLYTISVKILNSIDVINILEIIKMLFYFEIELLKEMGYGLNLTECALTKIRDINELYYISPKTGAGCTKEAGLRYKDKLFIIPNFFKHGILDAKEIVNVSEILGFFLKKHNIISEDLLKLRTQILIQEKAE